MANAKKDQTEESVGKYAILRPKYQNLVDEVKFALSGYVEKEKIEISEILGRVKSEKSFKEKISRKSYESPLSEMVDLAATRVVCLFESDLEKVKDLIVSNFQIIQLEDKADSLGDRLMGYQGYHLVIRLGHQFKGPRYDELQELCCEIQVRTVLQDAWSKISHTLVYKSEASVPKPLRRNLNNVSSLMEIAQSVFDTVKVEKEKYTKELRQAVDTEDALFNQEINHHTLMEYSLWKFPHLPVSSYWQDQLIADIDLRKYKTIADVEVIVSKAKPFIKMYAEKYPEIFKSGTDFITKSLGLLDDQFAQRHSFSQATLQDLKAIRETSNL